MLSKNLLITLAFAAISTATVAQSTADRTRLEKEKQQIQNELKQIQGKYEQVKDQKKKSLEQLTVLKEKIRTQEKYISNINREIKLIDDEIYLGNIEINRLSIQLDTLKAEYARSITYAYKNRTNDHVGFIFSAASFNDMIRRISYIKSYRSYREKQIQAILETQQLIAKRKDQQIGRKQQKNAALQTRVKEKNTLDEQRKEEVTVVAGLKSQEKKLQKQIAAKIRRDMEIRKAISAIIRKKIRDDGDPKPPVNPKRGTIAGKKQGPSGSNTGSKPTAPKKADYADLNAGDIALNGKFESNKGKLPWPVDNGAVKIRFGRYTIDKITGDNPGLTIATRNTGLPVKAVFDGVVEAVYNYGDGMAVIIRHGKYFTSYSNLASASVSKGSTIERGQIIGKVGEAFDGTGGQVDFILMAGDKNVNPEIWLRR